MTTPDTSVPQADTAARIAAAVLGVDGVVALHGGQFGEVATYLPGERITGVRIGAAAAEVHIVTVLQPGLVALGEQVRSRAEKLAGVPVTVTIADIVEDVSDE